MDYTFNVDLLSPEEKTIFWCLDGKFVEIEEWNSYSRAATFRLGKRIITVKRTAFISDAQPKYAISIAGASKEPYVLEERTIQNENTLATLATVVDKMLAKANQHFLTNIVKD